MNPNKHNMRIGLTDNHNCSYLSEYQERVAVALDNHLHTPQGYAMLLENGFRRSGDNIYRPYCDNCNACQSVRIHVPEFLASKSQKRLLNKSRDIQWQMKPEMDVEWFELYARYISVRHRTGSMYPPKEEDFYQFAHCSWLLPLFLHVYEKNKLIAVAVTDTMEECCSSFYTFFEPEHPLSLGTLAVLLQLEYCRQSHKQWLYLGYQIDQCPAMNYKVRFQPHQRLVNQRWQG